MEMSLRLRMSWCMKSKVWVKSKKIAGVVRRVVIEGARCWARRRV